jgi:small-conductance mechanosensitive channel
MRLFVRENFTQVTYKLNMAEIVKPQKAKKAKKPKAPKKKPTNGDVLLEMKKEKLEVEKEVFGLTHELAVLKTVSQPLPVASAYIQEELEGAQSDLLEINDRIKQLEALPAEAEATAD